MRFLGGGTIRAFLSVALVMGLPVTPSAMTVAAASSFDDTLDPPQVRIRTADSAPEALASLVYLKTRLEGILAQEFPEMGPISIHLVFVESSDSYLQVNLGLARLFKGPKKRTYLLEVNPKLVGDMPSEWALDAILVHEMKHVSDMVKIRTSIGLLRHALMASFLSIRHYERATDRFALERGYARGIAAYRKWLYPRLSDKDMKKKRRRYYTPEEICALYSEAC